MDEGRPPYDLKAPGPPGSPASMRLPGRSSFPALDDHLVEPEVTRDEIIGGQRVVAFPAKLPHATQHARLDYVIGAQVRPGFGMASDLLTRHDVDSDFASDTCVMKEGIDPETGTRYLEEIAFEVVSEQGESQVTEKALRMHRRGVRRIFALFIKKKGRRVSEWSPETNRWVPLAPDATIEDPCLVKPLEVAALLNAAAADKAVAEALIAKGEPTLRRLEAAAEARGKAFGEATGEARGATRATKDAILKILAARGFSVNTAQREKILNCHDLELLDRWLRRAVVASSADDITAEP
jgi:hypothetical protein